MNQIDNIMALADSFAEYRDHSEYVHARQALRAAIEKALAVQPKQEPAACLVGMKGSAFDSPKTKRAYTYAEQPGNIAASKLGRAFAVAALQSAGDSIDRGLTLLKELEKEGFGVFEVGAEYTVPKSQPEQELVEFKHVCNLWIDPVSRYYIIDRCDHPPSECIPAYIRTAPKPQPEQEPVALVEQLARSHSKCIFKAPQPQRKWMQLTANEILNMMPESISPDYDRDLMVFAREIEKKLREKNS